MSSHAAVEDEASDGVEVPLLRGVVERQEGLLVERVGVAAGAQQQLSQLQVPPAGRHVQDGVAVLKEEQVERTMSPKLYTKFLLKL